MIKLTPAQERQWWNTPAWLRDYVQKLERELADYKMHDDGTCRRCGGSRCLGKNDPPSLRCT